MEEVKDLLGSSKALRVRENPAAGRFFVDGLSKAPVTSYSRLNSNSRCDRLLPCDPSSNSVLMDSFIPN